MKEKLTSLLLIFLLGFVGVTCKIGFGKKDDDKKDKENATNLLGLVYLDQISGHCAEVKKDTSNGQTSYTAFLYPIPKGGCNADTPYGGTTFDAIRNKTVNDLKNFVSIIDNEFPNECSNTKSLINNIINNESNSLNKLVDYTLNNLSSTKFYPIGNMIEEAKNYLISLNRQDDIETEEDVKTLTPASLDEYKRYFNLNNLIFFTLPYTQNEDTTCKDAVENKINQEFPASNYFSLTGDNTNKNNKVLTVYCKYGSNVSDSEPKCTSLNEEF